MKSAPLRTAARPTSKRLGVLARPALALVIGAVSGCGTTRLDVDVRVLNPDYLLDYRSSSAIESLETQARFARTAISEGGSLSDAKIIEAGVEMAEQTKRLEKEIDRVDPGLLESDSASKRAQDLLVKRLKQAQASLESGVASIDRARTLDPAQFEEVLASYRRARLEFDQARVDLVSAEQVPTEVFETYQEVNADSSNGESTSPRSKEKQAQLLATIQRAKQDARVITRQASRDTAAIVNEDSALRGDPLLGHVLRAEESEWKGLFNSAHAFSHGTNSDIAIIMEDVDKFSVKGLRADSSTGAKAALAALGRVIDVAAVVSGVPVDGIIPEPTPDSSDAETEAAEARRRSLYSRAQAAAEVERAKRELVELMRIALDERDDAFSDEAGDADEFAKVKARLKRRLNEASKRGAAGN